MRSSKIFFVPALFFFMLSSCQDDARQIEFDKKQLLGRWEIDKAWRNGKQTETLTDTYYEFDQEGNMRTNLTPSLVEDEFPFSFSGNEIHQNSEPEIIYTVENLTDSLLLFSMTINQIPFRIQLKKVFPEEGDNDTPIDTL